MQSRDAIERVNRLLALWQRYRAELQETGASKRVLTLVDTLFERLTMTISGAARRLDVTPPAARKMIEKLEAAGILTEVTCRQPNRIYLAREIYEVVSAEAD
ncbi:MAG: hypothetical protein ACRDJH_26380 [Thermomicrobiales bacterium]